MANATVTRIGQDEGNGATDALFLKKFAGEVLTTFTNTTIMMPLVWVKKLKSGKSAQFPCTGTASSGYHTPGDEIVGSEIKNSERTITINGKLYSDVFLDEVDELKSHFETRQEYSFQLGQELAETVDTHIMMEGLLGARASENISGETGTNAGITDDTFVLSSEAAIGSGSAGDASNVDDVVEAIADGLYEMATQFDDNKAPAAGRFAVFRPREYNRLVQSGITGNVNIVNSDFSNSGNINALNVPDIAGFKIYKSTLLPGTDVSSSGKNTYHYGDFSNTIGLVGCRRAIGMVKLLDLTLESAYDIRRQGSLFVAKIVGDAGWLRPECLGELSIGEGG